MAVIFDGPNKKIIVQVGTDTLDMADVYSRWVDWLLTSDNSKYLLAFSSSGGLTILPGQTQTTYFYLVNGWKIDTCSEFEGVNHSLQVDGIILCDDFSSPFYIDPLMPMTMVTNVVPLKTETVATGGAEIDIPAIASGVWNATSGVETGMTPKQALRVLTAILAGKTGIVDHGDGTATVTFRDVNDTTDRAVADMTGSERTEITLTP
jgi:hypothetical protein